jgi:hypothetical protein
MTKRKSICITDKAYQILRQHCPSCYASPMLSDIIEQTAITPQLANIPKYKYTYSGKRKLLQITYSAWKRLIKFQYCFIFEVGRDDIHLNDIASLIVVHYYEHQHNNQCCDTPIEVNCAS